MSSRFHSTLAAALVAAAVSAGFPGPSSKSFAGPKAPETPEMVRIAPRSFSYRVAGDFTRRGKPSSAPLAPMQLETPLLMMKHQVTIGDYQHCVDAGACAPLPASVDRIPDRPVTMVNWNDATAYARWLSAATGAIYRLPTDEEWAFAAGSRFTDDALPEDETGNPARRSLARYERETRLTDPSDPSPRPVGAFGANEHGVLDLAGNVWEWTDTCFTRIALDENGAPSGRPTVNCGVRIAEGRHRAYVADFIRDARAGGCAAGVPPSHLGFRLVRDEAPRTLKVVLRAGAKRIAAWFEYD